MTPGRHSVRVQRILRERERAVAKLTPLVHAGLQAGWRKLYPKLRRIDRARVRKEDWIDQWYHDWQAGFAADMEDAFAQAITETAASESDFWTRTVAPVTIDPISLARHYVVKRGHLITGVGKDTQKAVRDALSEWYGDVDMTLADLVDQLTPEFGDTRAALIANTETTALVSDVTLATMGQLGLTRWTWQTRLEYTVCDICRPLHGRVFTIADPMPPDGSHIGCMCVGSPIVE
jgi:uncharacterized protein with gpF-like domain